MAFKDRIKKLQRVKAGDLRANPKNWRIHPDEQRAAMQGLLESVGFSNAILAYEDGGELTIIDGHLRADLDPNVKVPVLILDVTAEEADVLLASYDPIAAMGLADQAKHDELLASVSTENEAVASLLDSLKSEAVADLEDESDEPDDDEPLDDDPKSADADQEPLPPSPSSTEEKKARTDYIYFRRHQIPLTREQADELERRIEQWTDKTGTTHGFWAAIAKRI